MKNLKNQKGFNMTFLENHAELIISKTLYQIHCGHRKIGENDHDWFMGGGCLAVLRIDQYFPTNKFNFKVDSSFNGICHLTNELADCVKLIITEKEVNND